MSHLTHNTHRELGNPPLADLLDLACDNLRDGLRIEGERCELGDLVTMHRGEHSVAAAAVALPDFHERLSDIVSDDRLIVGLPCQNHLLVTGASSGYADYVREAVLTSPHPPDELTPSVLLVERSGMHLIAERP